eukprot:TRINITY_DN55200_c0_g1_i1.p2 TRINITY_DN55200_c0_g1~~TRINITY_DN55200_c0_g1_i1.p2  ORF type:complete len:278 (+),score=49.05 TRINITY_DN55200_c0_g1_i1:117-836(+)
MAPDRPSLGAASVGAGATEDIAENGVGIAACGSDALPARWPAAEAAEAGESRRIALEELPPLPDRDSGYRTEPILGICLVTVLGSLMGGATQSIALGSDLPWATNAAIAVWIEFILALSFVAWILFGGASLINRSPTTCFPMPEEVSAALASGRNTSGMNNIRGPKGSYCVRCFVWRPPESKTKSHHCSTCQRCVTGFDHHCGVFGRCIVRGNLLCFYGLLILLPVSICSFMAVVVGAN